MKIRQKKIRAASFAPRPPAARAAAPRRGPTAVGVAALISGSFALVQVPVHAAGLPTPCPTGGTVCKGLPFDKLNTGSTLNYGPNQLTVTQNAGSAIFNWQSFNITAGNTVQFVQPSNSSVALNRIFDPNLTTIAGTLKANGQVYLINPNGILFGSGAQVDVGGLIASTLNVSDQRVTKGLLYDTTVTNPVFTNNPAYVGTDLAASPGANPAIVVQPGATLYAAGRDQAGTVVSAGRVFLFAPQVENGGTIKVDGGGQAILASGSDVYLGSSSDPSLRGLLVEVSAASAADGVKVDAGGNIAVARGNVTLMGLAVSQAGNVVATSALDENGSIRLVARTVDPTNVVPPADPSVLIAPLATGKVTVASGSTTAVVLDPTDTATAPLNDPTAAALRSTITIEGHAVDIGGSGAPGSTLIQAHGGDVTVTARQASSTLASGAVNSTYTLGDGSLLGTRDASAVVNVGADATIDTSGLQHVAVDGGRNYVYIDRLTSNNLANAPLQRAGFLLGQGVYVNLASAPSWIDVSNLQAAVAGTQAERDATAGKIALRAEGAVNVAAGSVLDVSGGSVDVSAAIGRTSQLLTATGTVVDISNASGDMQYVGFADGGSRTISDPREGINQTISWQAPRYTALGGYASGTNAGTVQVYAPQATLAGTLLGTTSPGPQQRAAPPLGGLLQIGSDQASLLDQEAGFSRPGIVLGDGSAALQAALAAAPGGAATDPVLVDTGALAQGGFTRLDLTSDGAVELAPGSPMELGPGGQLVVRANAVAIGASIDAPGGTVAISERGLTALPGNSDIGSEAAQRELLNQVTDPTRRGGVAFTPGTRVDVAGLWTNDQLAAGMAPVAPTAPVVLNGGSIAITGRTVDVSGTRFDVSAGATLSATGGFSGGAGGSLSIGASNRDPVLADQAPTLAVDRGVLDLGSDFAARVAGYGVTQGGSLALAAPSLQLGGSAPVAPRVDGAPALIDAAPVIVDPALGQDGFRAYTLAGYDAVAVASGTTFAPTVAALRNNNTLTQSPNNASLAAVTAPQPALPGQPLPASITLTANAARDGAVTVASGAMLDAGAGGSIALTGRTAVDVAGTLRAAGGKVALALGNPDAKTLSTALLDARTVHLEDTAAIDVSGTSLATVNAQDLRTGSVLDGGTVALDANLGAVVVDAGASVRAAGATDTVDILTQATHYTPQVVASNGGVVEISAMTGVTLAGRFDAHGGNAGADGGRLSVAIQAAPITDTSTAYGVINDPAVAARLALPTDLAVVAGATPPPAATPNAPAAAASLQGSVPAALVNGSGFDQAWLQSADRISFGQSTTLATRGALVLAAPVLDLAPGAAVQVDAPYVALGPAGLLATASNGHSNNPLPTATGGSATLQVDAAQIDLVGAATLLGVGQATLASSGAVRGIGTSDPNNPGPRQVGSLQFGGNLAIDAAEVLPATQTDFTFTATADPADTTRGKLTVAPGGASNAPFVALSAGGTVTFDVADFASSGRVLAPQGTIAIDATRSITLAAGSTLSTQGDGLVPYGTVGNGTTWTYGAPVNSTNSTAPYTIGSTGGSAASVPAREVKLSAPTIDAQAGATIDIAGGGDQLGTQFVAGPGGSYDLSQNFPYTTATTRNPYFALVPALGAAAAPYDPQIYADLVLNPALPAAAGATFRIGQTITLAAGSGIPAGTYTVLPPRYALLPGAYAVQPAGGYQDLAPGSVVALPDGTQIVAGKLGFAAAGTSDSRWSGFRIYSDAQFRTLAEFHDVLGSQFFAAADAAAGVAPARVGGDAGELQVAAADAIRLAATIVATPDSGGRGAALAIDAPQIVVGDGVAQPAAPQPDLALDAATLSKLGAESLVLGATVTRSADGGTLALAAPAASVTLQAATPLTAGEVLLAGDRVTVAPGASVAALAGAQPATTALDFTGDGAALYVGNVATLPAATRSGASAPGAATVGTLAIGSGASIGGAAVLFDATAGQSYAPDFVLHTSNVALSAAQINLGAVPAGTAGLDLDQALLSTFAAAGQLTIASAGGFATYGSARIGTTDGTGVPALDRLTLVGPGIAGSGDASAQVTLTAGHVTLDNTAGASPATAGTGLGALAITAAPTAHGDGSIALDGNVALGGFGSVTLAASGRALSPTQTAPGTGDLIFVGKVGAASSLTLAGTATTLAIDASRITAQSGVDARIVAPGAVTLAAAGAAQAPEASALGASLSIQGQRVDDGGRIDLPAGAVTIASTGTTAADGITLEGGSSIRVAGVTQAFGPTSADVSAGAITLASTAGGITQLPGALLDLGGAGSAGDAGALSVNAAAGSVALQGTIASAPGTAARGAAIAIDALNLADPAALAGTIAAGSGGAAADSIALRVRSGNLMLAAGDTLRAHAITLEADGAGGATDGTLQVAGTLDASGASGGSVALYANNQVALAGSALIDVHATSAGATGGQVMVSARVTANAAAPATPDAITVASGAQIDAAGGSGGSGGTITLRANALGAGAATGADVAIAPLPAATLQASGAREIIVEGTIVDARTGPLTIDATLLGSESARLATYMSAANRAAMSARLLGGATVPGFSLRPGLQIDATGDITLAAPLDLAAGLLDPVAGTGTFAWRYGGSTLATSDPGALTLRSAGNLNLDASLSDGFMPTAAASGPLNATVWQGAGGESWRYTLTAGADLAAADPNRTGTAAANLTIGTESAAAPVTVRTGTGSIALNASQDVILDNGAGQQGNVVYTAGVANIAGLPAFPALTTLQNRRRVTIAPLLTQDGGNLAISAGRDVLGTAADGANQDGSTQSVNEWLFRGGLATADAPAVSWVDFEQFQQGFGTLGGGDLTLAAGRNVTRVGAVVPSVGYDAGAGTVTYNHGALVLEAGGTVQQGLYYDEAGRFDLRAATFASNPASAGLAPVRFAQGANTLEVQARRGAQLQLSFNPSAVDASTINASRLTPAAYDTKFFTYGSTAAIDFRVAAGDLSLTQVSGAAPTLNDVARDFDVAPPNLQLVAFGGNVVDADSSKFTLFPAADGQVRVLADGNLAALRVAMSQADPALLPGYAAPGPNVSAAENLQVPASGTVPLHGADPASAEFVARNGAIVDPILSIPKTTDVIAAGSIGPTAILDLQNSNAGSVSHVTAGQSIDLSGAGSSHVFIGGTGAAEVLAGGPIDLGTIGLGIDARGNFDNPNLPAAGASLLVAAGVGRDAGGLAAQPDLAGAIRNFVRYDAFAAAGSGAAALDAQVVAALAADGTLGSAAGPFAQALTAALASRAAGTDPVPALDQALAALSPAQLLQAAVKLASSIQVVNNQRFVATGNKETFAPAYAAFGDLFPNLDANVAALTQFVQDNPFRSAPNAAQLRDAALAGLPPALASALQAGLAAPAAADASDSVFAQALAALDPATLAAGARQLLANVLQVAGSSLDALQAAGRLTGSGSPYAKELTAFAAAYTPRTAAGLNDLQMDYNEIKTEQSGSVAVFAPQGSVVVGQSTAQAGAPAKSAAQLGIFTFGGGDIIGMARDNFDVFRSRVFTVAGGDIDLWSSIGNLDAGRGARDVAVAAPPRLVTDPTTGLQSLDFGASVTGSGIGALKTQPDQPPSNINLMAPAGYVDAGEAGIRADTGTVTLGTNIVLNAGNIQAASGVSGGAVVAAPAAPLPSSSLSNGGDKALADTQRDALGQQQAEQRAINQLRMRVIGEFIGFEDECSDYVYAKDPTLCPQEQKKDDKK